MKNNVQELAIMSTVHVQDITPKVISAAVEEIARDKMVWGQFYKTNKDLMANGGTEVVFPKKNSGISAAWGLTAGAGLTASGMSFSAVTIAVKKGGVAIGIYGEAIRQANRDVISDNLKEAGAVWAATLDFAAFAAMWETITLTACNKGTFVATSVDVVGCVSLNPSTITGLTFVTTASGASLCYASDVVGTVTMWRAASTIHGAALQGSANSLTVKDVSLLSAGIKGYFYNPTVLVVHPDRAADLVYDLSAKLLYPPQYAAGTPVYNGEIGQLWGLKIVVNGYCPKWAAIAIDPEAMGYQVLRKELSMMEDKYTGGSTDTLYFWGFAERNFGVINYRAIGACQVVGTFSMTPGIGFA